MFDLTIIIVTYNPGQMIVDCLHSLPEGARGLSYEMIVVDNASQDGTPQRIMGEFPQVRLIKNKDNRGFAAANNQGLAIAHGRHMLLLNPDVMAHPGAMTAMVTFLESNPTVGIVGPRIFGSEGRVAITARASPQPISILGQFLGIHHLFPDLVYGHYHRACLQAKESFDAGWISGACLMLRQEVYAQIGGLDDSLFLFGEEQDFCDRATQAGWRASYLPVASIVHNESSTISRYVPTKILHHHISQLYCFRKQGRESAVMVLKIGFTVELLVKIAIRLLQMIWHHVEKADDLRLRICTYRNVLHEVWRY